MMMNENQNSKRGSSSVSQTEKGNEITNVKQNADKSTAPKNSNGTGDNKQATINLPVGGGAIRGIGEKFQANPVTGTGSYTVPLAISEGRGGFTPQLALSYDSGSGNSVFGLGWNDGIPSISRKTAKELPQYNDFPDHESDTFILSGAEDLVPILDNDGHQSNRTYGGYTIFSYRPRTEGLFARIERWVNINTHQCHWRSVSKENIVSVYGFSVNARIVDPNNDQRVFSWLYEESWDAKGNLIHFNYKNENSENILPSCYENPRLQQAKFANKYLKSVQYGNVTPLTDTNYQSRVPNSYSSDFCFKIVFDYGDEIIPNNGWTARTDPFSVYSAGFEIRTYRLCKRILMYHHFAELGETDVLVRSTDLSYSDENGAFTLLNSVTHKSYCGTETETLPTVEFSYSESKIANSFKEISGDKLQNLPFGVDGQQYQWIDLYSEGISGIMSMNNQAWYFMPNYGDKQFLDPLDEREPHFGRMKAESAKPAATNNRQFTYHIGDVDSDGLPELIIQGEAINGYYSRTEDGDWLNFRNFENFPNINFNDSNLRFMDLSGDGLADIIISKGDYFDIYFSDGVKGYGNYRKVRCETNEGDGPKLLFSDIKRRVFLADMSGDGLTDIVCITNTSIEYYPNLGYGKFGSRVSMSNPPLLDSLEQFDPRFVFLTDVDGTGTTDLLYISKGKINYYKNLSGNAWEKQIVPDSLVVNNTKQTFIQTTDLLGNGTQCLVVSSSIPNQSKKIRYLELTSGIKPFLLKKIVNNMGAVTELHYAPSTKFYIQDKMKGTPWITKLPFVVHVLESVEITDVVSSKSFKNKYAYHHGYYDHQEREFRGFGMVEQWDIESYDLSSNVDPLDLPPVYTKTWFHTGYYHQRDKISRKYEDEYFKDIYSWKLPDTKLPINLTGEEAREACRALRGSPLRIEIYSLDGTPVQNIPYTVEEKSYSLQCLQHRTKNQYAIFLKTESETLQYAYERDVTDPRISHQLIIENDQYGNPLKTVQVAYPRLSSSALTEQTTLKMVYAENSFINNHTTDFNLIGIPYQNKQFEIHNYPYSDHKLVISDLISNIGIAAEIDYAEAPSPTLLQKRLFQHTKTLFWNQALTSALPLGQISSHALPYQQQSLELTQMLIDDFNSQGLKITDTLLENDGKYIKNVISSQNNNWYLCSEIQNFCASYFYLPECITDQFGNTTTMEYDTYHLFPVTITDALGFQTTAEYNYHYLQPWKLTEPNGNSQEVAFSTLGMVTKLALIGKNGEGDTLDDPTELYEYDLHCWQSSQKPVYAYVKKRELHGMENLRWLEAYVYTNGIGENIMTKTTAEDGLAWTLVDGVPVQVETTSRWLASGKVITNNKNKPIKQYEPWFSTTYEFENEEELTQYGVTPILYYDSIGRLIEVHFPDGTKTKVVFDNWKQQNFDQNDCDPESPFYNTPQIVDIDNLGRPFKTSDDNGTYGMVETHNKLDITGRIVQVTDALNRIATINKFALSEKHQIYVKNIDSGERWMIVDTAGKPLAKWDLRGHIFKFQYDELQRPTDTIVNDACVERLVYGTTSDENQIGQLIQNYNQSGKSEFVKFDFKGNLLCQLTTFCEDYSGTIDWNGTPLLIEEEFKNKIEYNAFNKPLFFFQPDGCGIFYYYDKGGLLNTVVYPAYDGSGDITHIQNITYNARGQRENIYYGNNTKTRFDYNPLNFRLTRVLTTRNNGSDILQDLNYTYDSVGNIIEQYDDAQQIHYFDNEVVYPINEYTYDPLYRLLTAKGRELSNLSIPTEEDFVNYISCPNPSPDAIQKYTQTFQYDQLGNILQMSSVGNWTRDYEYNYPMDNNYLIGHGGGTVYTYDSHGNMLTMPHLTSMEYDYQDQLISAGNGTFTSYYNYDGEGNRTRKVVVKNNIVETRYYINGYEIYRKTVNGVIDVERLTVNISDDSKVFVRIEKKSDEDEVIRYQYDNHLGSACLELDVAGLIISYEEYHPFGTTSYRSGANEIDVSLKRYKYCGKERDEETGLYYYGMRYYAAWLCKFINVDPLQFKYPYYTPFQYAGNKPITYIDLDGGEPLLPLVQEYSYTLFNYSTNYYTNNGTTYANDKFLYENITKSINDQSISYQYQAVSSDATYVFVAPTNSWNLESYNISAVSATWENPSINQNFITPQEIPYSNNDLFIQNSNSLIDGLNFLSGMTSSGANIKSYSIFNSKGWVNKSGKFFSSDLLKVGENGKYVRGVQGYRNSAEIAQNYAKQFKTLGNAASYFGGALILGEVLINSEITVSNGINAFMTGISFTGIGAPIASVWFAADFMMYVFTGRSISDRIDDNTKSIDWEW